MFVWIGYKGQVQRLSLSLLVLKPEKRPSTSSDPRSALRFAVRPNCCEDSKQSVNSGRGTAEKQTDSRTEFIEVVPQSAPYNREGKSMRTTKFFLVFLFGTLGLRADGPIGPTIDNRPAMERARRIAEEAKREGAIRFQNEQAERERRAAMERERRAAIAQAEAQEKELAKQARLNLIDQNRAARERQGEAMLRSREERAQLAKLTEEWRVVNGTTNNMAWAGWKTVTGYSMETHDGWIKLRTRDGDICLTNLPVQLADGESVSVQAADTGLHRYTTRLGKAATGTFITLRKYDCGRPCPPPAVWLASAKLREEQESRLRTEEDARMRVALDQNKADVEAFERAQAEEAEHELAVKKKQLDAIAAESLATQNRVITFQHQQASNGYGSFQFELGRRYLLGNGVPQSKQLATFWLQSACTNGLSEATNLLAKIALTFEIVTDSK